MFLKNFKLPNIPFKDLSEKILKIFKHNLQGCFENFQNVKTYPSRTFWKIKKNFQT